MKSRYHFHLCTIAILLLPFAYDSIQAQTVSVPAAIKKTYGDWVKNSDLKDGLFSIYTDREDGSLYIGIKHSQLDQEFIHFGYVMDGLTELGFNRGRILNQQIFVIRKHFDRLEFIMRNTKFYFDPENALSRASDANISDAIVASIKIVATTEDKTTYLLRADELFLKELFIPIKATASTAPEQVVLGDLSTERTRFHEVRNYPENSLFRVRYVYENRSPKEWGKDDVTDARYITIDVQHAIMAVPKNDYQPRYDDPRVGYFTSLVTDLTSPISANYRDPIHRWYLKKKNPDAAKSDPVEPIVWWIENTTPVELRDTIRQAVEAWNLAFESAGFTNAITCKIQPDDAKWDAGDIRYNVIRWTSSPNPPFGGYGPRFANPRTGQILGADIMLEYVFLTNRLRLRDLLRRTSSDHSIVPVERPTQEDALCEACLFLQESSISAQASLAVSGVSKMEMDTLLKETLTTLVLHEIGHTLGLNHNFRSSQMLPLEQLNDKNITTKKGLTASVMDYVPANLSPDPKQQGQYYTTVPGPYDHWAIRYGYTETKPEEEAKILQEILEESTHPEHAFGNDADDMRTVGRGIDPRVMLFDMSSDAIGYAIQTIERVRKTISALPQKYPVKGESYQAMLTAYVSLMGEYERAASVLSRYIGGVYVDRSMHGQTGATAPYTPVPAAEQERAITALETYVFAPGAYSFLTPELLSRLQVQRRGFEIRDLKTNEDPKVHEVVANIQNAVLNQILHGNTLGRILDSTLYGNSLPLPKVMERLNQAIMEGKSDNFRDALQVNYIERLVLVTERSFPTASKEEAVAVLEKYLPSELGGSPHQRYLRRIITRALEKK